MLNLCFNGARVYVGINQKKSETGMTANVLKKKKKKKQNKIPAHKGLTVV